ncbi:MAG: hypothetical protein FJ280_05910 [Planctomycetes bacterium]|nr:hypothetical protein [Planctomycetota bacterium]
MSLMKWLRKNNKKLMAVVVIVLMVAFVGGSSLHYLLQGTGGANRAIAYYGQRHKITPLDRHAADYEIRILSALRAERLLQAQDLRGLFLSELVFRESRSGGLIDMARQTIQRNRYRVSDRQLQEMLTDRRAWPDIYWILLSQEAQEAGIRVSNEEVGQLLERLMPQLFEQRTYAQMMPVLMSRFNVPEEEILTAFGKLIAVLQYAQIIASLENVTAAQIKHLASNEAESLDAEFVQLKASDFIDKGQTPPESAVLAQFEQYKANFPGAVGEANPFGFGYRLPDRVQFDYLVVKLADVAAVTRPPTEEDAELYYQQNRDQQFTEQVPTNPDDPNSPQRTQVKSYAEVVDTIMDQLRRQRITTRAEQILQEARNAADARVQTVGADGKEVTVDQRRDAAGDYAKIAESLREKHNVPLYSGRTGLVSALNMQNDSYLRRMFLVAYGQNPIPLMQILFSAKALGEHAAILLSMPRAEMYVSVGPVKDPTSAMASDLGDQVMMIARLVAVEKNAPPADVDVTFSTRTLGLDPAAPRENDLFSVREQVVNDVKALAAWDTTKSRAEELKALATQDGWDKAIARFNEQYGPQAKADPNDPNVFTVDHQIGLQKVSEADLQVLAAQVADSPASQIVLNQAREAGQFVNALYALIPPGSDKPAQMPVVVESQPGRSVYVLKDLAVRRLTLEEFQKMKGMIVRREEYTQAENLAAVHFGPENILKRMNFRYAEPVDEPAEGEGETTGQESKEAS